MKPFKILIPTDFSDVSNLAFQMAGLLSLKIPLDIHVLHVIEANTADPDFSEGLGDDAIEEKSDLAKEMFSALASSNHAFKPHIKVGLLTEQINLSAAELAADLIIMGTKGSEGFMEKISGSEAQHVARYLTVPVLTLRPGTATIDLANILLVADFELFGKAIEINTIKAIARAFDSTIHLLRILKPGDFKYLDQIQAQMKFFAEEHDLKKFEIHLFQDQKVADGVRNFNREVDMDLVCIGTHGRKGISHLLFGSIAERLVNHCIKPLLTFQLK